MFRGVSGPFWVVCSLCCGPSACVSSGWWRVAVSRWSLVLAAVLTVALVAAPLDGSAVASMSVTSVQEDPGSAAELADEVPSGGELSAEDIAAMLLPSQDAPEVMPEVPGGDFSAELKAANTVEAAPAPPASFEAVEPDELTPPSEADAGLEVVARDEFSTTFERADGSFVERVSAEALNARGADGEWAEITTEFVKSDDGSWGAEVHPLEPVIASRADADAAVTVSSDGHEVSFGMQDVEGGRVAPRVPRGPEPTDLVFRGVQPGIDLKYELEASAVRDCLISGVSGSA